MCAILNDVTVTASYTLLKAEMEKAYKHWGMMVGSSPASDGRVVIALDFGAMDPEKLCLDKGGLFMLFYIYYDLHFCPPFGAAEFSHCFVFILLDCILHY